MGLFNSKNSITGTALGVSGAFDQNKKTDKAVAYGVAVGASLGSGKKWTMADSVGLGLVISAHDKTKKSKSITGLDFIDNVL